MSEPVRLGEILPGKMAEIERRMAMRGNTIRRAGRRYAVLRKAQNVGGIPKAGADQDKSPEVDH